MKYVENPKTKGSGIICAIPQKGKCPMNCKDCFFQSGRSYLEPLENNLPNMPPLEMAKNRVVRINDGNDSNIDKEEVIKATQIYPNKFYNTSIPNLQSFDAPVVLTINPGNITDTDFNVVTQIPKNLMFVRIRVNTWNLDKVVWPATHFYTSKGVPVVFTFMAYYNETVPAEHKSNYIFKKRTLNSYWCIRPEVWKGIMDIYKTNKLVYSCGANYTGTISCKNCGNCLREYFATKERMNRKEVL